jgi:hypothetical protein
VFGLVTGFIEILSILTTSNFNALADLHILHVTIAHAGPSQCIFTSGCLVKVPNNVPAGDCFAPNPVSYFTIDGLLPISSAWRQAS